LEDGPSWVRAEIKCLQACLCIDQGLYSHLADIRAELLNLSQKVEDCLQANRYRLIVTQLHLQEPLEDGLIGEQYIEESRRLLDSVIGLQDPATQALRWESAFLRADLASLQTQQDALLSEREALQRAQQDFVLERQAHTLTHSDWRTLQPEGCSLFDAYMLLIEARIAWTDTRLAWREGREGEALAHQQLTESLLESLLNEERYTLSPFLREQARSGLQALQTVPQGQASTQELTWSSLPLQTHLGGSQQ
jgi:ATP-dependent Clp protease ATP-binding subunit ClpA